ncbi:ABC transporter ATP-binding protein [Actinomyces urogenitalis]|uniref:ABC transporter ATP-binding protein n=1 Tax=Actinomyces urogenitalis TaxID=103621 RepID=UPI002430FC59|nr:ABC transporter ATP-binding protein [Actinomyces urogenitalis]MCI7456310.1 ABC transporter ATP-binding protein [Actinomyces urogenitalis]
MAPETSAVSTTSSSACAPAAQPAAAGAGLVEGAGDLAVTTHQLTKSFGTGAKARTVVNRLDLAVPRGVVYGFLGPNGAGKSTTMKMLLGLLAPSSGRVRLLGQDLDRRHRGALMARTGSMIEQPPGYAHLTGAENMRVVQRMLGLTDAQVDRALSLVRLTEHKDRLVRSYSMGMKQRLGIAMALARQPELLILDEPTNGLDPAGTEEIRHLLVGLAAQGVTVMVSSHLLDEIDKMATVLGILSSGHLVFQGTRDDLMARSVPDVRVVTPARNLDARLLEGIAPASAVHLAPDGLQVEGLAPQRVAEMVRRLVSAGAPVYEVRRQAQSLEDVFMDLTGGAGVL